MNKQAGYVTRSINIKLNYEAGKYENQNNRNFRPRLLR
jgi:ribosomal protein S17E